MNILSITRLAAPRAARAARGLCVALAGLVLAHAAWSAEPQALLKRAADAIGPAPAQGLRMEGSATFYDPHQSPLAGGEPRRGTDGTFVQWRDAGGARSRTDWRVTALRPVSRTMSYTEVLDGATGHVTAADSFLLTRQAQKNPHPMSNTRAALNARELLRTSPDLVRRMLQSPSRVTAAPDLVKAGRSLPTLRYASEAGDLWVAFDPDSGLPAVVRSRDYDPIEADADFDLVLDDWRAAGAMRAPHRLRYQLNGTPVADIRLDSVVAEAAPAGAWDRPQGLATPVGAPARHSFQWFFRKQGFGVLVDSDGIVHDPEDPPMTFTALAPAVWLATGGFYNTLVVELDDELVVYDAPHEVITQTLLREAAQRFPGKPIRHVVLTHHHLDHAGGLRGYLAAGATIVVGQGLKPFLLNALRRPVTQGLPALQTAQARQALDNPKIVEVDGPFSVGQGAVRAQAFPVSDNPHAQSMLIGYVPSARFGFVSDLWSPGRGTALPAAGTEQHENLAAFVRSVRRWNLQPDQFAGGHGRTGSFATVDVLLPKDAAP